MTRPAASIEEFERKPAGTWVAGHNFLYICHTEQLYAFYLWGQPDADETRRLIRVLAVEMRPEARPHRAFADFRGLTGIDSDAFAVLRDFLEAIKLRQREVTIQEAVVRPGGMVGTIIAGFFVIYPQLYPTRVFTESEPAAEWLGLDEATHREWDALRDEVRGISPETLRLRQVLEVNLLDANVAQAAKLLGLSTRTLQRKLRAAGTSFQRELDGARLAVAEPLISGSHDKLASIALRVGFSSPQHFSEWYRRQTGRTAEQRRAQSSSTHG
jgi:AraC-like DNA-binding protein/ABC-type transporter Mla MlaB component